MNYTHALLLLTEDPTLTMHREAWHENPGIVGMTPRGEVAPDKLWSPAMRRLTELSGKPAKVECSLTLWRNDVIRMGWLPTVDDLLSDDWVVE